MRIMYLIFVIDVKKEKLCEANDLDINEVETVKIDDKWLAKPGFVLKEIKKKKYKNVFFGCIELDYQRFHFFMKMYFLISGYFKGTIIDEKGRKKKFSFLKLFFVEFPLLVYEIIASSFVIALAYVKFPIMKWYLTKK